jgi:hypothetical protein|tara:strand:+ start:326 stop:472 length:147 start_codon:yes stop_codon:yes gene_type:complete
MKDKLLAICENVLGAFTMLVGIIGAAYLGFIALGLWAHLHQYALSAYK